MVNNHGRGPGFRSRQSRRLQREQRARERAEHATHDEQSESYHDDLSAAPVVFSNIEGLRESYAHGPDFTVLAPWYLRAWAAVVSFFRSL
jgi:hypothetical protein